MTPCKALLAVLSMLLITTHGSADPLGRLFVTPAERAALTEQRRALAQRGQNAKPEADKLEVNGIVTGGASDHVWVNGERADADGAFEIVRRGTTREVVVHPRTRRPVALKPGQAVSEDTGEVREGYQLTAAPP